MKVIKDNKLYSVSADSEDTDYPATNLQNEHIKLKFKADGDYQATLTCSVSSGSSGGALFGTNAQNVTIVVQDPNYVEWVGGATWEGGTSWVTFDLGAEVHLYQTAGSYSFLWEYPETNVPVVSYITLVAPIGTVVEAGVLIFGLLNSFPDPEFGLTEGSEDYSIEERLSNGARYYKKRDIVRTFSFSTTVLRGDPFYEFMSIAQQYGRIPFAWRLTNLDENNWIVYGYLEDTPKGVHSYPYDSTIQAKITEVI